MRRIALSTLIALAFLAAPDPAAAAGEPWDQIVSLRQSLAAGEPEAWSFTQTYVPAGFRSGESESGSVLLGLPDCVRWDYAEPYPKSFLLCGATLRSWTRGEKAGEIYSLDERQPGLDLLLLDAGALARRYRAKQGRGANGATVLDLTPRKGATGALRSARLVIAPGGGRLSALAYTDADGNRTTFAFAEPRAVAAADAFSPPAGVRWERASWGGR